MRPLSRISCHGQSHASDQKNRSMDKSPSRKCNRYQTRERPWPTCATNTLAINRERAPQAIGPIGLVSYNSETLSENHYRKCFRLFEPSSLNAFAAKNRHRPRQMPRSLICSALRRERTPRPRSQRRQGQPWPGPQACATAARKECPAQSRGNRTSRPHP